MSGQDIPYKDVMVEQRFPSSPTVVEPRFPHGSSVAEQGHPHDFMAAEQELPHQESTFKYGILPSHVSNSADEDTQCVEEGDDGSSLQFASLKYRIEARRKLKHRESSVGTCPRYISRGRKYTNALIH